MKLTSPSVELASTVLLSTLSNASVLLKIEIPSSGFLSNASFSSRECMHCERGESGEVGDPTFRSSRPRGVRGCTVSGEAGELSIPILFLETLTLSFFISEEVSLSEIWLSLEVKASRSEARGGFKASRSEARGGFKASRSEARGGFKAVSRIPSFRVFEREHRILEEDPAWGLRLSPAVSVCKRDLEVKRGLERRSAPFSSSFLR